MSEPIRLSRRVIELTGCSRREAELYIEGGWVRVDGVVVEQPQHKITGEQVSIDPAAKAEPAEPATLLLHQPAREAQGPWRRLPPPQPEATQQWPEDASGIRPLHRHLLRLQCPLPLDAGVSGLLVLSQDWRVLRRLTEDAARIEQEYLLDVEGQLPEDGLTTLAQSPTHPGSNDCKVSWQSEQRLRFAGKRLSGASLRQRCQALGLRVLSVRRLRIGRVSLGKLPPGQWRYLPFGERF